MKKVNKTQAKAASKKSPTKRKRSTKALSQTHGKVESTSTEFKPTSLDQIWGDTGEHKYQTMDAAEYEAQIRVMPKVDLHAHASRVGIVTVDNRDVLSSRLIREFKKHVSLYRFPDSKSIGTKHSKDELSQTARSVLNEGK